MRFLLLLVIAGFAQSSFFPLNLCLLILLSRMLLVDAKFNLTYAFVGGAILSFLTSHNLAFYGAAFLIVAKLTQVFKASPLSANLITALIYASLVILSFDFLEHLILQTHYSFLISGFEILLFVPVYLIYLFWEERFVAPIHKSLILKKSLR